MQKKELITVVHVTLVTFLVYLCKFFPLHTKIYNGDDTYFKHARIGATKFMYVCI